MDFSDEVPARWWITQPERHIETTCVRCDHNLDWSKSIPMTEEGGFCATCAPKELHDTPMTATYIKWLEEGDPRWWSPWICNCCRVERRGRFREQGAVA